MINKLEMLNLSRKEKGKNMALLTQLTRLRCPCGSVLSNGFLPVRSSRRTMPKLYTSLLAVI